MILSVLSGIVAYFYTHDRNNYLQKLAYGNGDSVQYEYNDLGRVLKQTYEDGDTVTYQYDNDGALAAVTDSDTGITTKYYYDFSGSTGATELRKGADIILRVSEGFDENNRLTAQNITFADGGYKNLYTYNPNGTIDSIVLSQESDTDTDGKAQITYTYDDFLRILGRTSGKNSQTYTYFTDGTATTSQVTELKYANLSSTYHFDYTYDEKGNIETYTAPGKSQITYTYDSNNQLTEAQGAKTYSYEYDEAGNITKAVKNGTTYTYTYGDSTWKDLLTAYNGNSITYDTIGNPTKYYNGWNFTWEHGREMATATNGSTTLSFKYDADGLRTSKTVNGVVHNYYYYGGKLLRETYGTTVLDFYYDANGVPYMLEYNGTLYYYVTNAQGDVIRIVNASGTSVADYEYDPYGSTVTATGSLATINPLRYRGYYFDSETGLYYLQSRYYDSNICRFINPDEYPTTGQGLTGNNMFAYCGSNPITREDADGKAWNILIGAAVGAIVSAATTAIQSYKETGKVDIGKTLISAAVGAVSGGIAATGLGMFAQAAITAGAAFAGDVATQKFCEGKEWGEINYAKAAHNGVVAGGTSMIGSALGGITSAGHSITGNSMVSAGRDKLLTGYARQAVGQSHSQLIRQGNRLVSAGMRYVNTGRGISSVTGTVLTWGVGQKYSWS